MSTPLSSTGSECPLLEASADSPLPSPLVFKPKDPSTSTAFDQLAPPAQLQPQNSTSSSGSERSDVSANSQNALLNDRSDQIEAGLNSGNDCHREKTGRKHGERSCLIVICVSVLLVALLLLAAISFAFSLWAHHAINRAAIGQSNVVWARFDGVLPPISDEELISRPDAAPYYTYPNKTGVLSSWRPNENNDLSNIRVQPTGDIHFLQSGLYEISAQVTFFKKRLTLYTVRIVLSDLQQPPFEMSSVPVENPELRSRVVAACYEGPIGLKIPEKLPEGVHYEMHTCSMSLATYVPPSGTAMRLEYRTSPELTEGLTVFYDNAANYVEVLRVGD